MDKWQGRVEEKIDNLCGDVVELKKEFGNHLKDHAKSLKESTTKWFFLSLALIAGIFSLITFILTSMK